MQRQRVGLVAPAQGVDRLGEIVIADAVLRVRRGRQRHFEPRRDLVGVVDLVFVVDGIGGAAWRVDGGEEVALPKAHQGGDITDGEAAEAYAPAVDLRRTVLRAVAGRLRPTAREGGLELAQRGVAPHLDAGFGRDRVRTRAARDRAVAIDEHRQAGGGAARLL